MRAAFLLAALLLSGCVQGGFGGVGPAIPSVTLPSGHGVAAGSASGHAAPSIQTGQVTTSRDGSRWRAVQEIDVRDGFGGADRAAVSLASLNGGITVKATGGEGYHATVTLRGTGTSEQMARDALATLTLRTPDSLGAAGLDLGLHVVAAGTIPSQAGRGADIDLQLPRGPLYNLAAATSNGPVTLDGLTGETLVADTSNSGVTLTDLAADTVTADTSNGPIKAKGLHAGTARLDTSNSGIDADGTVGSATLDTSNGPIDATLRPAASGRFTLDTSNSLIRLALKGDGQTGFDATADTSNGRASIALAGGEAVGSQEPTSAHVRTTGYAGKAIRTEVRADTSNSDVTVTQG